MHVPRGKLLAWPSLASLAVDFNTMCSASSHPLLSSALPAAHSDAASQGTAAPPETSASGATLLIQTAAAARCAAPPWGQSDVGCLVMRFGPAQPLDRHLLVPLIDAFLSLSGSLFSTLLAVYCAAGLRLRNIG